MNDDSFGRLTGMGEGVEPPRRSKAGSMRPGVRRTQAGNLDALVRAALDNARHGLIVMDPDFCVRLITRGAIDLLGIMPDDAAIDQPVIRLLSSSRSLDAASLQTVAAALLMTADGEPRQFLMSMSQGSVSRSSSHKSGRAATGNRVIAMDVRQAGNHGWVASLEDVTQTRQTQDWLLEHASTDPVTGLWNRQHFMLMLQDRLDAATQDGTVMLLIALARPKPLNQALGPAAGDGLLRIGAGRLTGLLREDDLLARFPAYEFAVAVSGSNGTAGAAVLAERIVDVLSRPYAIEGHMVSAQAQVGIARSPADGTTPEALSAAAAMALSNATQANAVCFFDPALNERARRRRHLEHDLARALAAEEFELWYQPQVDLKADCIRVFEALIRWRSPTRGLVSPADFIPLAEETGLIVPIGDWVLQEACREAAGWPADIAVAVNASALQFETGHFGRSVARALTNSRLPGRRLEIEVTESLLLHEQASVEDTMTSLRELDVRLVLDDFGTGYASLSQLSRFKFHKIKIDRSFISPPDVSPEHCAIVRSIAALGASLGIPTTAEGVETIVQLDRIRADGCSCVQGYYFSKPVPADGIPALLARLHHPASTDAALDGADAGV
jgi:diguanylate cyclase (GGDEF)-like protein